MGSRRVEAELCQPQRASPLLTRMHPGLCSTARPQHGKVMEICCLGGSSRAGAMSTGGIWWLEQYSKVPRVHIWLVQRPVPAVCIHGPPAAPPVGCVIIHL